MPKKKIHFYLPNLKAGGAERVMSYVAQNLDKEKFEPTLYIIGYESDRAFQTPDVRTVFLNRSRVLNSLPSIYKIIKYQKPDIVVSAIDYLNNVMAIFAMFFRGVKFVGREVNVTSVLKHFPEKTDRKHPKFLGSLSYRLLDIVICQSTDMLEDVKKQHPYAVHKLHLINNPITEKFKVKPPKTTPSKVYQFITVGSLELRKGHPRILEALAKSGLPYNYTMIGDGSQKEAIYKLIEKLGIEENIVHIPFTSTVNEYLSKSDVFLQGSYVEGFPNALLESCAVGTPVVAFDAPGGINEIVEEQVNGYIAQNEEEFLQGIQNILLSKTFVPEAVSDSVYKKYSSKIILSEYEKLFQSLV